MRLKWHQTIARYLLGILYVFGAVDGVLEMGFHIYLTGESELASFHGMLQHTAYFWVFLKGVEAIGGLSLVLNLKPAFGTAILAPITAVLCLFYAFDLHWYYALIVVGALHAILLHAYWPSYRMMFADYPMRRGTASVPMADPLPEAR
ncbi:MULTISPECIES: hypothetical protein [Luteibacter]|uniref:DoxX family protein n=1 Tax=Luteibacter flocculans TaxID=2780091 RepID=A0ABY4T493_9GAMM|nr:MULTISPECIES: hypothetical protein [Luteibacter]URL59723.1 hypothetical protein IM816_06410 [Luteibacter flocculans]SFW16145.1 hypothetical protein SAMN02800691_0017 [Luteibacter sp. UNCMF366Tsu5.1]